MKYGRILIGLFIISIGGCMALENLGNVDFGTSFSYVWPIFLMLWGITFIFERRFDLFRIIVFFVGVFCFINNISGIFNKVSITNLFWPAIIVLIGLSFLFRRNVDRVSHREKFHVSALFGGRNVVVDDEFTYAECNSVFGGTELNLYNARFTNAVVDANAVFGGATIIVPKNIRVIVNGTPIFGGVDNKTQNIGLPENAPVLTINASAVFGGIEIKN